MGSQKRIAKVRFVLIIVTRYRFAAVFLLTNTRQELAELVEAQPEGMTVQLADESNLYDWNVYMQGPEGSPYYV